MKQQLKDRLKVMEKQREDEQMLAQMQQAIQASQQKPSKPELKAVGGE